MFTVTFKVWLGIEVYIAKYMYCIYNCDHQSMYSLGHKPYKITYASDYFPQLYEYAVELIKRWF